MKRSVTRIMASLLVFCLLADHAPAAAVEACLKLPAQPLAIPKRYGVVTDSFGVRHSGFVVRVSGFASKKDYSSHTNPETRIPKPVVVLIQDLHANVGVQKNIAHILLYLQRKYRLRQVFVEGGIGEGDVYQLRALPKTLRRDLEESFLRRAYLTGSELAAAESPADWFGEGLPTLQLQGVENKELYLANWQAAREVYKLQRQALEELRKIRSSRSSPLSPLLAKLLLLRLTEEEWNQYQAARRFEYRPHPNLPPPATTAMAGVRQRLSGGRGKGISGSVLFQRAVAEAEAYYRLAIQRNAALAGNMLARFACGFGLRVPSSGLRISENLSSLQLETRNPQPETVVLVTGGFHTPGLKAVLTEHRVPYVVIQPRVETLDQEWAYRARLAQTTLADKLLWLRNKLKPSDAWIPREEMAVANRAFHRPSGFMERLPRMVRTMGLHRFPEGSRGHNLYGYLNELGDISTEIRDVMTRSREKEIGPAYRENWSAVIREEVLKKIGVENLDVKILSNADAESQIPIKPLWGKVYTALSQYVSFKIFPELGFTTFNEFVPKGGGVIKLKEAVLAIEDRLLRNKVLARILGHELAERRITSIVWIQKTTGWIEMVFDVLGDVLAFLRLKRLGEWVGRFGKTLVDYILEYAAELLNILGSAYYRKIRRYTEPLVETPPVPLQAILDNFNDRKIAKRDRKEGDEDLIRRAYLLSEVHGEKPGAVFSSGQSYFSHATRVAYSATCLGQDAEVIVAALLQKLPKEKIRRMEEGGLWSNVDEDRRKFIVNLIKGLDRMLDEPFHPAPITNKDQHSYLVQCFTNRILQVMDAVGKNFGMYENVEEDESHYFTSLLALTMADKLQTISTVVPLSTQTTSESNHHTDPQYIDRLYAEIMLLYAPLAERLGMPQIGAQTTMAAQMRNDAFKVKEPENYALARTLFREASTLTREESRVEREHFENLLPDVLQREYGIAKEDVKILSREKTYESFWQKLQTEKEIQKKDEITLAREIEQRMDLNGLMVIVKTQKDFNKIASRMLSPGDPDSLDRKIGDSQRRTERVGRLKNKPRLRTIRNKGGEAVYQLVNFKYAKSGRPVFFELQIMTEDFYLNNFLSGIFPRKWQEAHWKQKARQTARTLGYGLQQFSHQDPPLTDDFEKNAVNILTSLKRSIFPAFPIDPKTLKVDSEAISKLSQDDTYWGIMELQANVVGKEEDFVFPVAGDWVFHPDVGGTKQRYYKPRRVGLMHDRNKPDTTRWTLDKKKPILKLDETLRVDDLLMLDTIRNPLKKVHSSLYEKVQTPHAKFVLHPKDTPLDWFRDGKRMVEDHFGAIDKDFETQALIPVVHWLGLSDVDELFILLGAKPVPLIALQTLKDWYDLRFVSINVKKEESKERLECNIEIDEDKAGLLRKIIQAAGGEANLKGPLLQTTSADVSKKISIGLDPSQITFEKFNEEVKRHVRSPRGDPNPYKPGPRFSVNMRLSDVPGELVPGPLDKVLKKLEDLKINIEWLEGNPTGRSYKFKVKAPKPEDDPEHPLTVPILRNRIKGLTVDVRGKPKGVIHKNKIEVTELTEEAESSTETVPPAPASRLTRAERQQGLWFSVLGAFVGAIFPLWHGFDLPAQIWWFFWFVWAPGLAWIAGRSRLGSRPSEKVHEGGHVGAAKWSLHLRDATVIERDGGLVVVTKSDGKEIRDKTVVLAGRWASATFAVILAGLLLLLHFSFPHLADPNYDWIRLSLRLAFFSALSSALGSMIASSLRFAWADRIYIKLKFDSKSVGDFYQIKIRVSHNQIGILADLMESIKDEGWDIGPGFSAIQEEQSATIYLRVRKRPDQEIDSLLAELEKYQPFYQAQEVPPQKGEWMTLHFPLPDIPGAFHRVTACLKSLQVDIESVEHDPENGWLTLVVVAAPPSLALYPGSLPVDYIKASLKSLRVPGYDPLIPKDQLEIIPKQISESTAQLLIEKLEKHMETIHAENGQPVPWESVITREWREIANKRGEIDASIVELFEKAWQIVFEYHGYPDAERRGDLAEPHRAEPQFRKSNGAPYVVHLAAILNSLIRQKGVRDPIILLTALLHDILENAPKFVARLGKKTATEAEAEILKRMGDDLGPFQHKLIETIKSMSRLGFKEYSTYIEQISERGLIDLIALKLMDRENNLGDIYEVRDKFSRDKPLSGPPRQGVRYAQEQIAGTLRYFLPLVMQRPAVPNHVHWFSRSDFLKQLILHATDSKLPSLDIVYEPNEDRSVRNQEIARTLRSFIRWMGQRSVRKNILSAMGLENNQIKEFRRRLRDLALRLESGWSNPTFPFGHSGPFPWLDRLILKVYQKVNLFIQNSRWSRALWKNKRLLYGMSRFLEGSA